MDKKHIGFVCHEYPPCKHGGIGSFTKDLAEALVEDGYDVTVIGYYLEHDLSLDSAVDEYINGVRVIRYPRSKLFKFEPLNTIRDRARIYTQIKLLHKEKIFCVFESPAGSGWLPFGLPYDIPLISRLHGGEVFTAYHMGKHISKMIKFFEQMQLKHSNEIIAVSNFIGNEIKKLVGFKKDFITIYNSISAVFFQKFDADYIKGRIVFTGTVRESKGIDTLIKACTLVFEQNPIAHLVVAGRISMLPDKRPYTDKLKSLIPSKFWDRIEFVGPVDRDTEMIPLLKSAQVCCFPSYFESFSLASLEAAALGKAVIYTKLATGKELFVHKVNAMLINPMDHIELSSVLLDLLNDQQKCNDLGIEAQKNVTMKFGFDKFFESNLQIYKRVGKC